jgi:hypothetical protein
VTYSVNRTCKIFQNNIGSVGFLGPYRSHTATGGT